MATSPTFLPATIRPQVARNMSEMVAAVELCVFCEKPPGVCQCAMAHAAAAEACALTERSLFATPTPAGARVPFVFNSKPLAYQILPPQPPPLQPQLSPAQPPPRPAIRSLQSEYGGTLLQDKPLYNRALLDIWNECNYVPLDRQDDELATHYAEPGHAALAHPEIQKLLAQPVDNEPNLPDRRSLLEDPSANSTNLELLVGEAQGQSGAVCPQCNKKLKDKDSLNRHKARHNSQIHRHQCEHCPYKSIKKTDVERHKVIHTKAKDFVCSICQKAFNHRWNRKRHEESCRGPRR